MRKLSLFTLTLILVAPGLFGCGARPARTNVLLIVVDTLRKDRLGCYGYELGKTPWIDRLAASGVRYERAVSVAPWTTPAIAGLMTSRYPSMLGIRDDRSVIADEHELLAEILRAAGYRTGAIVSHSFCSAEWNFDQGFDEFDDSQVLGHEGISSPEVSRRALEFLEEHVDQPFFLWLHYFDPHWRYAAHPKHARPPDRSYDGPVTAGMAMRDLRKIASELDAADIAELERQYDAEITFTDHHIGRVLKALGRLGLDENTLVVFVADHGEEFLDHGDIGHAHTLHREVLDVPLIVRYPGQGAGVVEGTVSTLDVLPTILDVLGLAAQPQAIGRSFRANSEAAAGGRAFSETGRRAQLRSVTDGQHKLIRDLESGRTQVFDLTRDPGEHEDLAGDPAASAAVEPLRSELERWIQSLGAATEAPLEIELTADQEAELRALGYGGE